jgi:predicted Zn-dependent protease
VAAVAFAVGVVAVAGIVVYSSMQLTDSRDAVARGDLVAAADDANAAADVEPFSPEPPLQLALVYELAHEPGRAQAEAQRAIDRAPGDWRGWALAARIDRSLSENTQAAAERARAEALVPVPLPAGTLSGSG